VDQRIWGIKRISWDLKLSLSKWNIFEFGGIVGDIEDPLASENIHHVNKNFGADSDI